MAKFVEVCYVDAKGVHNKLYKEGEKEQLVKDVELIEKLVPNAPVRILGRNKNTGKPLALFRGSKFTWNKTNLIVEVVLLENDKPVVDKAGSPILFTYITRKYVNMGDKFQVRTVRGNREAIVSSRCWRKTEKEIDEIALSIGYTKLVVLQDVIVK